MDIIRQEHDSGLIETTPVSGHIRILNADSGEVLFSQHNVIVNVVKSLFARLMANNLPNTPLTSGANLLSADCLYAVWGLALGTGDPTWSPDTQPVETPGQIALIAQVLRKQLSAVNYVTTPDSGQTFVPVTTYTNLVDFQTLVNATTDNLIGAGIREMGLIGGGTKAVGLGGPTNMLTAPFWDPANISGPGGGPTPNSVTLINYKTLPPLILPPGINLIFSWILSF